MVILITGHSVHTRAHGSRDAPDAISARINQGHQNSNPGWIGVSTQGADIKLYIMGATL